MNRDMKRPKRYQVPTFLTETERAWLRAIADNYGVSMADASRMMLHAEAERRGLKDKVTK
jgi:hypothetical protein